MLSASSVQQQHLESSSSLARQSLATNNEVCPSQRYVQATNRATISLWYQTFRQCRSCAREVESRFMSCLFPLGGFLYDSSVRLCEKIPHESDRDTPASCSFSCTQLPNSFPLAYLFTHRDYLLSMGLAPFDLRKEPPRKIIAFSRYACTMHHCLRCCCHPRVQHLSCFFCLRLVRRG